ncbi:MAG TPA: hypothetical protein PKA27_17260 [Fimbriimonadaceae bacterium]|nr:hypothetical protein [Fimbriimonadaceae bacterium]
MHYSAEGPEPLNVYQGPVRTDERGFATVELPDYYESINIEPTVQLTVVDDGEEFVLAKVVNRPKNGSFVIRTNHLAVRSTGESKRKGMIVGCNSTELRVEIDKSDNEKGKYQRPELYGLPAERSIMPVKGKK